MLAVQDSIDVSQYEILPEDFGAIYKQVVDENPELFYVKGGYGCDAYTTVSNVYPYYELDSAFVQLDGTWYYLSYSYNENSGIRSELMQTQDPAQAGTRNKLLNAVWYNWTDRYNYAGFAYPG